MSVTTFTTVNGRILRQNKDGVVHNFVSDPLGSVVMVRDTSGNTVYEAEYDPYGNVQSETGTNPSSLGFVGTLGYIKDSATSMYVRARYLLNNLGRWLTKDPLWPNEPGYVYAGAAPSMWVDPIGLSCEKDRESCFFLAEKAHWHCHTLAKIYRVRAEGLCKFREKKEQAKCKADALRDFLAWVAGCRYLLDLAKGGCQANYLRCIGADVADLIIGTVIIIVVAIVAIVLLCQVCPICCAVIKPVPVPLLASNSCPSSIRAV